MLVCMFLHLSQDPTFTFRRTSKLYALRRKRSLMMRSKLNYIKLGRSEQNWRG